MREDFIHNQMKRCNKNLFIISLLGILVVVLITVFCNNYFYKILKGPYEIDVTSLGDFDTQNKDYVTVMGTDAFHSGAQYFEATHERGTGKQIDTKVISDYVYLRNYKNSI